jgi:hypothetical protein
VTGLGGTGRLADDLYLMAHHDRTGKPLLQPRAAGLGLAGGLLTELVLAGHIEVEDGEIAIADRNPPEDELAGLVLAVLLGQPQHPARDWLAFLARTAAGHVPRRLEQAGYLTRAAGRTPWSGQRWVPVDPDCAFAPVARAQAALRPGRPPAAQGTALAGLAVACGLGSRLLPCGPPQARRHLDAALSQLDPGLHELIAQTQAAVDSALLSHRV